MRFRSVLFLVVLAVLLSAATASAQKRVFTTVDPNADAFSDTIDIFDPKTGAMTRVEDALTAGRERPAVLQLTPGRVLIAGGVNNRYLNNAEIYNHEDSSVKQTGDLLAIRGGMSSILAPGSVALIIGGYNGNYIQSVEQYDSVSEKFIMVSGGMTTPRQLATATLLSDRTIFIAGGFNGTFLNYAEIYDPSNRTFWAPYETMKQSRVGHIAALISDKRILLAGGCNNSKDDEMVCDTFLDSAEIYDVSEEKFTLTGKMTTARKDHTANVLGDGRVLIVGGTSGVGALKTAEIYNPETGVFAQTGSMTTPRVNHTATFVNGLVVIAGGEDADGNILNSVEIYDPATGTFTLSTPMSDYRTLHSAVVVNDGAGDKVLFVAGIKEHKLVFDTNHQVLGDNIAGNIYFHATPEPDSKTTGFVAYTGSGTVLAFNPEAEKGGDLKRIVTGGRPIHITPILIDPATNLPRRLAVVSALDNKIFIIDPALSELAGTYEFPNAVFGFGSRIELSPDGQTGYISSSGTGEVIKFNVATGQESGRLSGLRVPAQITITSDGKTLMVVDAVTNTVKGVDADKMTLKYTFAPQDRYYAALFSIHNKVVLNDKEDMALITSQDVVLQEYSAAFLFDPATGEWILYEDKDGEERTGIYLVGFQPGWTMLLPNKEWWLTLSQNNITLISTIDPRLESDSDDDDDEDTTKNYAIIGSPMGSTNVILTPDGRYAFFASATNDQILHMDLETGAIVGAYALGDDPNLSPDQPIAVALTPDAGILAAASYVSNEISLFVDSYLYRQTRYVSQQDGFTGISIVNVYDDEVIVQITARTNSGGIHTYYEDNENISKQKTLILGSNAQVSIDISELLEFDNDVENTGYLTIDSQRPVIVGYTAVGKIQSSFLTAHIRSMENVAFFAAGDVPRDMILPEVPEADGATSEVSLVNPSYTSADYTVIHYAPDGTKRAEQEKTLSPQAREATSTTGVTSTVAKSQVAIIGGLSSNGTESTAEVFDGNSSSYRSAGGMRAARYGSGVASLASGKVLVSGGRNGSIIQKSAELYNPSSGSFTFTPGSMNVERYRHTATRLPNGLVLLAGGQNTNSITRTAELFDYTTGSFSYTKNREGGEKSEMVFPRDAHTATLLTDGVRVLLAGGLDGTGTAKTAEIYNTATGRFTQIGDMRYPRAFHTATLLGDGRVLFTGGYNGDFLKSAEVFNPATNEFEEVSDMMDARSNHTATLLSDGTVLIAGGRNHYTDVNEEGGLDTAEVYDPSSGYFSETGNTMTTARSYHTAVNFMDDRDGINDRVIISGGFGEIGTEEEPELGALATSDIYTPGTRMFTRASSSLSRARQGHAAILLDESESSGYLRFTSEMGLLASESYNIEKGGAPASVSAIDMAKYKGVKTVYSPRFTVDADRTTLLNVINGNEDENPADITLELFGRDGGLIASTTRHVAANAQIKGDLKDIFNDFSFTGGHEGWIKVSSTEDQVVGTVTFKSAADKNKYMGSFELSTASPLPEESEERQYCFIFPLVSENSDFETELSFLNSGTAVASLTLQLWDANKEEGSILEEHSATLDPGRNMYKTISGLFGKKLDYGNVRVRSDQPIHGMGEIRAFSKRFITPVPATLYKCSQ
ncbi:MAG: hypothetical protein LBJ21_02040 [Acidobacteriota bacterium]|jgi:WD40 repeat protein|nr:hypothetical protein [Acidobacteriota bacterium]